MTEIIRVGNKIYREIPSSSRRNRTRRYSPKRDSSTFFKSNAQKAYESRKELEYIQNKRRLESEKSRYKQEHRIRKMQAKARRKEQLRNLRMKAGNTYNTSKNVASKSKSFIANRFKRKQKSTEIKPQPQLPYKGE